MDQSISASMLPDALQLEPAHELQEFPASAKNQRECIFISCMRATDVVSGLRRIPTGFYIAVQYDGKTTKTSNNPALPGKDEVEWNDHILLPSEQSSSISISIYASSELGPTLGNGELLRQFTTTVGEVLERDQTHRPIKFHHSKDPLLLSCSSLSMTTERRFCNVDQFEMIHNVPELESTHELTELTDRGHHAFLCYSQLQNESDLKEAVLWFEYARDECPLDHPNRSTVLFNLAKVMLIQCQASKCYLDLDLAITLYQEALELCTDGHPDYNMFTLNLGLALLVRFHKVGNELNRTNAKHLLFRVLELCPMDSHLYQIASLALQMAKTAQSIPDVDHRDNTNYHDQELIEGVHTTLLSLSHWDPQRPKILAKLGILLYKQFEQSSELGHLQDAISALENAIELMSNGDPHKVELVEVLGGILAIHFKQLGDMGDVNKFISMLEEVVILTPNGHPYKPILLNNLGHSLQRRFEQLGDIVDMDKSVSMLENAVNLIPNEHPNKPNLLNNLAASLQGRFKQLGDMADMNKSISVLKEAINITPNGDPLMPELLQNHGTALLNCFDKHGDITDITKAISILEEAVNMMSNDQIDHPCNLSLLNNLGISHRRCFEQLGSTADINKSVSILEEVVTLVPNGNPDKPRYLHNLGYSLQERFEELGDIADRDRSILMFKEAVNLSPNGHPDKITWLNNLGGSLQKRFEQLGDIADINESVSVSEEAVNLVPNGHPDKPTQLNSLGVSLRKRFEQLGDKADMNKFVSILEEAVHLTPNGHPDRLAGILNNLGCSLQTRFQLLGDIADINKSVSMLEMAVNLTPNDHSDKLNWLNSLGASLMTRFVHLNDITDINKSVSILEDVVNLTPDDYPHKPIYLNNFCGSLQRRFERLGDVEDINKSISGMQKAIDITPNDHLVKKSCLNNLAGSLQRRFQQLGDIEDINKSITMLEEAVNITPNGHYDKTNLLTNLGTLFFLHFKYTQDLAKLIASIQHFSVASQSSVGSIFTRFLAACKWIRSAYLQGNQQTLLDAYTISIHLLPQFAWFGLPLMERHRLLSNVAYMAQDAAAAAIKSGHPKLAVEWLEQGRSIVWTQFLQLRAPVDELALKSPGLAKQFHQICQELEHASWHDNSWASDALSHMEMIKFDFTGIGTNTPLLQEKSSSRYHDLAVRREDLLKKIRSLPDFDHFLLPRTIEHLSAFVQSGPVVYLNASSKDHCDALIVMENLDDVIHVPLSGIKYPMLEFLLCALIMKNHPFVLRNGHISELVTPGHNPPPQLEHLLNMLTQDNTQVNSNRDGKIVKIYNPENRFCPILAVLWETVVHPVLNALGFSASPSGKLTRIFWCPTGPFAFLPIHAAGIYGSAGGPKLSDFVISSYIPTLSSLAPPIHKLDSNKPSSRTQIQLLTVPQPPHDGQEKLPAVKAEMDHIKALSANSEFVALQESHGTIEDVMEKMASADWVHFACHGVQDHENPLNSGLCLADKQLLKLSDIIRLSCPQGGLAFLSACQTATGDEKLSEESVHLAAGMLLAGYGSVIATMWSIKDHDAPKVARDVYEYLFREGKVPDSTESAEALHYAVQHLRESGAPFSSWAPFIHFGH